MKKKTEFIFTVAKKPLQVRKKVQLDEIMPEYMNFMFELREEEITAEEIITD